ncbi:MAG: beta-ketoacyl synthase N-terminal-like domain-containing protein, partial [Terriglobia bacterium]
MARRVVVTGVGLVSPVGVGTEETWKAILAGESGVAAITRFDTKGFSATIAGEVKGFDPLQFIEKKELKKMGRFIQFAMAAAQFAMQQSELKLNPEMAHRTGVFIGSGIGGFDVIEREHTALMLGGPRKISPFFIPATIVNLASGFVSIRWGAKGPNSATCTACSS